MSDHLQLSHKLRQQSLWKSYLLLNIPKFYNNRFGCSDTQYQVRIRHVPIFIFLSDVSSILSLLEVMQITTNNCDYQQMDLQWDRKFARTHLISNLEIRCFNFA